MFRSIDLMNGTSSTSEQGCPLALMRMLQQLSYYLPTRKDIVHKLLNLHALPVLMSGQVSLERTHSAAKRSFSTPKGERKATPKAIENRPLLSVVF